MQPFAPAHQLPVRELVRFAPCLDALWRDLEVDVLLSERPRVEPGCLRVGGNVVQTARVPSADPHCTYDPNNVPKAVDVITPTGVAQATELDYTLGPVVLAGVTIP